MESPVFAILAPASSIHHRVRYSIGEVPTVSLNRSGQPAFARAAMAPLNRDERLFDTIRVQISAPFVQDQFRRSTVAVGHKSDLRVKRLKIIFANALRKYLILMAIYLRE